VGIHQINKSFCWLQILHTSHTTSSPGLQKWVVTDLPPLKESRPEIPKLRLKEIRKFAPKIFLSLPSCFILRVIAPLNLEKLNLAPSGESDVFLQDTNRSLTIGQVMVEINRAMVDVLVHFRLIGNLETPPELGYMKDTVKIRQLLG
jgi:hypothetical protein